MKLNKRKLFTIIILFTAVFCIYRITGPKNKTHLDYFVPLANAFLHKRLYLTDNPPWLNELVPVNGKFYVVFPPMPAILLMPFVFVFGPDFNQTLFSQILGSINSVLMYLVARKLKFKQKQAVILSLLLTLGTNHWYTASVGSAWYLALITGISFTLLSLLEFFSKRRFFLIGILIGLAYWSRLPTILSITFPLLYIFFGKEKKKIRSLLFLISGVFVFLVFNFTYNYLRFGTIFDVAYIKIPGILEETDFQHGLFSPFNIPKQLKVIFFEFPRFKKEIPYIYPSWYGMAIWITTPALFLITKANLKKRLAFFFLITTIIMSIPTLNHSTVGFTQFGYRYSLDFIPFLIILTGLGFHNTNKKVTTFLLFLSFLVNFWGVIWINKFGWVGW